MLRDTRLAKLAQRFTPRHVPQLRCYVPEPGEDDAAFRQRITDSEALVEARDRRYPPLIVTEVDPQAYRAAEP